MVSLCRTLLDRSKSWLKGEEVLFGGIRGKNLVNGSARLAYGDGNLFMG